MLQDGAVYVERIDDAFLLANVIASMMVAQGLTRSEKHIYSEDLTVDIPPGKHIVVTVEYRDNDEEIAF